MFNTMQIIKTKSRKDLDTKHFFSEIEQARINEDLPYQIRNLVNSLSNEFSTLRSNRPILWHMCGIGRGIYNFIIRTVKPIINPLSFLRGIVDLLYLLFTDPVYLIKQIINSGVDYAKNDPVAFVTELAINIILIALTMSKLGLVSAFSRTPALSVIVPSSSTAITAAIAATFLSSKTFFSLKTKNDNLPTQQVLEREGIINEPIVPSVESLVVLNNINSLFLNIPNQRQDGNDNMSSQMKKGMCIIS